MNEYRVHISGFFGYDAIVDADSKENAEELALKLFVQDEEESSLDLTVNDIYIKEANNG